MLFQANTNKKPNQTKPNQSESPASKTWDSLVVLMVMNPPVNAGDSGSIPGSIPWRRKWQPTSVFLPGESHGQRSLVGYRPWGCKELDTTERLTLSKPQPSDCFREEGPGVCRMRWPERKQAGTQGCWGCWPALLLSPCGQRWANPDPCPAVPTLLTLCPSSPRGWACVCWGCSQWIQPPPGLAVRQPGLAAAGFAQLPRPRRWLAVPSIQKEMWPEVRNEGGIAEESSEGRDWLLGRNTSALWPGAVDRGLPAGRIIGLSTALPATPGMNYFRHTSQQKSTCWLLFLEWLLPTVPLAILRPVLPTPAWTEILSSKNSSLTLPWLYRVFSCPRASST